MTSKTVIELGPFAKSGTGSFQLCETIDLDGFSRGLLIVDVISSSNPGPDYAFQLIPVDPQSGNVASNFAGPVDGGTVSPSATGGAVTCYLVMPVLYSSKYGLQVNIASGGATAFTATVIALD